MWGTSDAVGTVVCHTTRIPGCEARLVHTSARTLRQRGDRHRAEACHRSSVGPAQHRSARNNKAEVGTPSPLVTRRVSAPTTWEYEVPPIRRAPSKMRFKP